MLRKAVDAIKPNLWISVCNQYTVDFLKEPWFFDILLVYKPTFMNMDLPLDHCKIYDFLNGNSVKREEIANYLSDLMDWDGLKKIVFDASCLSQWSWSSNGCSSKIVNVINRHLKENVCFDFDSWDGWQYLWRLHVAPLVKVFMWRLIHGRTPTFE